MCVRICRRQVRLRKTILLFLLMAPPFFSLIRPISSANAAITELNLNPVEDAYVDSSQQNSNFGNSSYLYARFWDYSGNTSDVRRNSYLKFNLSVVSTEVNIVYARLELYCWSAWSPTPDVGAHYCADDSWNENETTWNNSPSFSSTPTCVISILDTYQWYAWEIGKDVKTALDDGILTVVLRVQNVGDSFESSFYSKEGWSNYPRLVIGYATPISCSVSPSVVTLGNSVTVSGCIPIPLSDITVQLTYTRPDMLIIVRPVTTNSDGNFTDTYTPNPAGVWSVTAAWDGAEGYNASSSTDMFVVTENERDSWAIIIGVQDYKDQLITDLEYTDDDAIELYNKLREVWPEDHLKLLINEEANKSNIESAIKDWLAPKETSESVVLFFFSGHGRQGDTDEDPIDEADGKDEYICPYDALKSSTANDIRDDTLNSSLSSLDSQHISVFLDSCYSGGFIDKATEKELPPPDLDDGFAKDLSKGGRVIITASNETESSWEDDDLEHGVFTYYMLEGLDNLTLLDGNRDNEISAEEIFLYVEPRVRSYTEEEQHPQMYDGYEGNLTLITAVTINLDTNPFKASITIDEVSYPPPVSFVWPLYTEHTIHVSKQGWPSYGTRCLFTSWNDGNNSTSRTIIVSEFVLTNYIANYHTQFCLTVNTDPIDLPLQPNVSPQGPWYDNGTLVTCTAQDMSGYAFDQWTIDGTSWNSGVNPIIVTMDGPYEVTAHYIADTTGPSIGTPFHEPYSPSPDEKVTVSVDVTDDPSGVHEVILSYTTDGGETWNNVTMEKTTEDTYVGEIPELPAGTNVEYKITAYENADNDAVEPKDGEYYVYQVVPEFPTWTAILTTLCIVSIALMFLKRRIQTRPKQL